MALSEEERRLLADMERRFYASESDSTSPESDESDGGAGIIPEQTNWKLALFGSLLGLAIVLIGVWMMQVLVGVLGFIVITGAVFWAMTGGRNKTQTKRSNSQSGKARDWKPKSSMGQKLHDRWEQYLNDN